MTVLFNLIFPNDFAFSYTRLTLSIAPLSHILIYPYFPKALSNSAIQLSVFSSPPNSLFSLFLFSFFLFIVVIICYIYKFLLFFTFITTSQHQLGVNLPRRFFGFFKPSEWQDCARDDGIFFVVISTKWNAWRNPLRRSSTIGNL